MTDDWISDNTQKSREEEFDFGEEQSSSKIVTTVFGKKGEGKTASVLGMYNSCAVVCFDHKTSLVKEHMYGNNPNIKVYDGLKYYSRNPKDCLKSAEKSLQYIIALLNEIAKTKPEAVIFDGTEVLTKMCEQEMRRKYGVTIYGGISNMNIWKYRNDLVANIHKKAIESCTKGVIYTIYTQIEEIIEDGNVKQKREVPKYFDTLMMETDIVLHAYSKRTKIGREFFIEVTSSKIGKFLRTGDIHNMTGKKMKDIVFS